LTTARQIITGALGLRLNKLSPGEALDADVAALCLDALNEAIDEINGLGDALWRQILTPSATGVSGITGTIGTTWPGLSPSVSILGASYNNGSIDIPMASLTIEQYQGIPLKSIIGLPESYAFDGLSTVYIHRGATGQIITLRTSELAAEFADLDTAYVLPNGYQGWLSDLVAERVAFVLIGGVPGGVTISANKARANMKATQLMPSIIGGAYFGGRLAGFLSGR
jgi:hypothetical protein